MEMPKSCWECRFNSSTIDHREACLLTNKTYNWGLTTPPSDCPLVHVPPHGDLIDREETKRRLAEHLCKMKPPIMWPDWNDAVISICTAPAVIPAEEGET